MKVSVLCGRSLGLGLDLLQQRFFRLVFYGTLFQHRIRIAEVQILVEVGKQRNPFFERSPCSCNGVVGHNVKISDYNHRSATSG